MPRHPDKPRPPIPDGRHPRKCQSRSRRSGKLCNKWAIQGGFVCMNHGGAAPQVRRKAQERLEDLIDPNRVLRAAANLAYSDIRDAFDDNGNLLSPKKWPDAFAAAVSQIEIIVKNLDPGDGKVDEVHKLKLWDKPKNIELLFEHLGLKAPKTTVDGTLEISWVPYDPPPPAKNVTPLKAVPRIGEGEK